ncbi:hypothetical protein GOC14_06770 [Sinorhizobium meliloti]|nr:hypothetical protein [Sinorhizobium meliloti]
MKTNLKQVAELQDRKNSGIAAPVVALRESSIVSLASHGILDATQVAAALQFRDLWEQFIDISRPSMMFERVDQSRKQSGRIEARDTAKKELARFRTVVGVHGFQLLAKVCGDGFHIRDLYKTRRERDTAVDMLKIHLTEIATLIDKER